MVVLEAVVLGMVQGLTEFLPISSSAHLILVPWALRWHNPLVNSLSFDVALHLGTLVAVVAYFRADLLGLARAFWRSLMQGRMGDPEGRLAGYILLATLPAGVAGVFLERAAETVLRSPWVLVATLSGVGLLMAWAERVSPRQRDLKAMTLGHSLWVGAAQALALVPGVSRSGITITAALLQGYTREAAARFSFLLGTPVIAGAAAFKMRHWIRGIPPEDALPLVLGVVASAVTGYLAIAFLMNFLRRHSLYPFVVYRLALAAAVAVMAWRSVP